MIRGTARMEAFADGVSPSPSLYRSLELPFPALARGGEVLGNDLIVLWPAYLGYALASLIIGLYWVQHHFSGAIYRTTGHWFLLATVLFLTMIGFVAFPARVFAEHLPDPAARPAAAQY